MSAADLAFAALVVAGLGVDPHAAANKVAAARSPKPRIE